ncbi:MAG TPA: hypothetical protein VGD77_10280 [Gemmatimonadaceae bacterium]
MSRLINSLTRAAAASLLLVAAACSDTATPAGPGNGPGQGDPNAVARVELSADSIDVLAAGWAQIQPVVRNARGQELTSHPVSWSTSDSAIAFVTSSGSIVTGVAGTATLTASAGGKSASARVRVLPLTVARIEPSKPVLAIEAGFSEWVFVTLFAADGRLLEDRRVTWSSGDSSMVVVANGKVRGLRAGIANVIAESEGKRAVIRVEVGYPKLFKSYRLAIYDLVGNGTRCWMSGIILRLDDSHGLVEGIAEPSWDTQGMHSGCAILGGGTPPFSTPEAPFEIDGVIDGLTLKLFGAPHWEFRGNFRGSRVIDGVVIYREVVNGEVRERKGSFELFDGKEN